MITFHASETGRQDYLDFHDTEGSRFYLDRAQARRLAWQILAETEQRLPPQNLYISPGQLPREELTELARQVADRLRTDHPRT